MKRPDFFLLIAAALVGFLPTPPASAQNPDNTFELEYTYSSPSEGEFEDEVTLHEGKANAIYYFSDIRKESIGFGIGAGFQANVWEPDDSNLDELDLYKAKLPVFFSFRAADSLIVGLNATPGIHSDFEDVDEDDFRVDGSAAFTYVASSSLQLSLGAAFGEEFGDPEAYPIGGVRWQATKSLLFDLVFPRPRIHYAITDGFRVYAFAEPTGGEWNVGDSDAVQVDVQQKGVRAGAGVEIGLGSRSWLYVAGGVEAERELQLAINEEEVFDDDVELDDQAFIRVGFRVAR